MMPGKSLKLETADLRLAGVFDRVNLQAAIDQLPEGYKKMFLLHDLHGYEHNEIAEILYANWQFEIASPQSAQTSPRSPKKVERYRSRGLSPAQPLAAASSI